MINKYAMMMVKMAYDMPKVAPVPPDKSDRIFGMINGNTDSVAKWFPPETYAKYRAFDKTASLWDDIKAGWNSMSEGEKMWYGLAGVGGGAGGYLLSRLLHRRRSTLRTLAYILGGGAAGLAGTYAYYNKSDAGKEAKNELRRYQNDPDSVKKQETVAKAKEEIAAADAKREAIADTTSKASWLLPTGGAMLGAEESLYGKFGLPTVSPSGAKLADRIATQIAKEDMKTLNDPEARATKAMAMLFGPRQPHHGKFYDKTLKNQLLHPLYFLRARALRRIENGMPVTGKDNVTKMDLGMSGQGIRDAGIDAGANALLYGAGGEAAKLLVDAMTPKIAPSRDSILAKYNLTPSDIK